METKYYEIEIQINNDDTESKGIYSYTTQDDAEIVFHQKVASGMTAIKNGTLKKALNLIIDSYGNNIMSINKEAVEPEPNEE